MLIMRYKENKAMRKGRTLTTAEKIALHHTDKHPSGVVRENPNPKGDLSKSEKKKPESKGEKK
jgi:hypothetical protein